MPVYNAEEYVARALSSLVGQTYRNIEVLAIDDGSTDNSLGIMRGYAAKDKRVKVMTQPNSGPARARNSGLDAAAGEYIMFCDADDWYNPDMVEKMAAAIGRSGVDLAWCSFAICGDTPRHNWAGRLNYLLSCKKMPVVDGRINSVMLWDKIFKKSVIDKYGVRFPDGHEHDDTLFAREYGFVVKDSHHHLEEELYNHTIRRNSIADSYEIRKPKNRWDSLYTDEMLSAFLKRHSLFGQNLASFAHSVLYVDLRDMLLYMDEDETRQILGRMNRMLKGSPFAFVMRAGKAVLVDARYSWLKPDVLLALLSRRLPRRQESTDEFVARVEGRAQ